MTSQFLLKGHKLLNFLFAFYQDFRDFENSYLWKTNRYQQTVKSFLFGLQRSSMSTNKKIIKNFDAQALDLFHEIS